MNSDPVEIVVIDHAINSEELSLRILVIHKLNLEWAWVNSHELREVTLQLKIIGIDVLIGNLKHLLAVSISPLNVEDIALINHELCSD